MDKPAKGAVLNVKISTGFSGCTKCLQKGKSLKKNTKGKNIYFFGFQYKNSLRINLVI